MLKRVRNILHSLFRQYSYKIGNRISLAVQIEHFNCKRHDDDEEVGHPVTLLQRASGGVVLDFLMREKRGALSHLSSADLIY